MKPICLSLLLLSTTIGAFGQKQWLAGLSGSYNFNDIVLTDPAILVTQGTSYSLGVLLTYLPDKKKPGVKFGLEQTQFSFSEFVNGEKITYRQTGVGLQFMSHLFLKTRTTRFFIDAGPSLFYMPGVQKVAQQDSALPDFELSNLNKVHVLIGAGAGITQQLSKIHLSIFSSFTFDASKVFPKMDGLSNLLILKFGGSIQYTLGSGK